MGWVVLVGAVTEGVVVIVVRVESRVQRGSLAVQRAQQVEGGAEGDKGGEGVRQGRVATCIKVYGGDHREEGAHGGPVGSEAASEVGVPMRAGRGEAEAAVAFYGQARAV